MDITSRDYKHVNVVRVTGQINAHTASELEAKIKEYINAGHKHIVLEADGITFLSSAGLRVLVTAQKSLKALNGHLTLSQPAEIVNEVLNLAGLETIFPVYETTEAAVAAV